MKGAIIGITAIIAFVVFLGYMGWLPEEISGNIPLSRQNIPNIMHGTIDPIDPTFIQDAKVSCTELDGDWIEESTKMGCFDIPASAFDATNCLTAVYSAIGNTCNSIDGAKWVCTSNNVGCYY